MQKNSFWVGFFLSSGQQQQQWGEADVQEGGQRADKRGVLQIDASHGQRATMKMSQALLGLLACLAIASFTSVADAAPL